MVSIAFVSITAYFTRYAKIAFQMSFSALDCEIMKEMASSPVLLSTLIVCDVCCMFSIPLLLYWLQRLWKMKLMHFNTRLLVCFHIVSLILHLSGRYMHIDTI